MYHAVVKTYYYLCLNFLLIIDNNIMKHILLLLLGSLLVGYVKAWAQWDYYAQWWVNGGTEQEIEEEIASRKNVYYGVWSNETLEGAFKDAPRPRRGHTMVLARTPNLRPFYGHNFILMFGGRDNENNTAHVPRTYNIQKV